MPKFRWNKLGKNYYKGSHPTVPLCIYIYRGKGDRLWTVKAVLIGAGDFHFIPEYFYSPTVADAKKSAKNYHDAILGAVRNLN